jgi:anaerobic dimethyl sulfoxide reductase subunit B (iron-sulfur subunit)
MVKQLAFYFNSNACSGCKACQMACKDKNNLPSGVLWRRVYHYGGGDWIQKDGFWVPNDVFAYSVSIACNHCKEPVCLSVCPTRAIEKRNDGVVLINTDLCIGCRYCEWACPYGAPQFDEDTGYMTKCNFCVDLIDQGQNPACVDACTMRCIEFGELADLRTKYGELAAIEPLPSAQYTHPSIVLTPHKHAQLSGEGTGRITNLPEEV